MASLGTYESGYKPWTPANVLPENGESITWDWMDAISQFSQRFNKIATYVATFTPSSSGTFSYESLGCDYFFPILKAYYHSGGGTWKQFDVATTYLQLTPIPTAYSGYYARDYSQFIYVTKGSCCFYNGINGTVVWQLVAYM